MIVIKDVEILKTQDIYESAIEWNTLFNYHISPNGPVKNDSENWVRENIIGRKFINSRGEEVIIGATKKVQDTIGLTFEAFENMGGKAKLDLIKENKKLKEDNNSVCCEISNKDDKINELNEDLGITKDERDYSNYKLYKLKIMSFWDRLKFLFGGYKWIKKYLKI